ncbi:hypothetical protein FRC03_011084 [Tulasnella sp. 419]|nr:hypothetical protein FRC03_011084 [Tulasnella sp. 419]
MFWEVDPVDRIAPLAPESLKALISSPATGSGLYFSNSAYMAIVRQQPLQSVEATVQLNA